LKRPKLTAIEAHFERPHKVVKDFLEVENIKGTSHYPKVTQGSI